MLSPTGTVAKIDGGVLADRLRVNIDNLLLEIDVEHFLPAFRDNHDMWHAEPEFAGHYVDAALAAYRSTGDDRLLERTRRVIEIMCTYQRDDGYLGAQGPGLEFSPTFGVWNQQFSIMALLSAYLQYGDQAALAAARRCADFVLEHFLGNDGADLFDAINQGIEHSCILVEYVRLFEVTRDDRYLAFAEWIVDCWERGSMRLVATTEVSATWGIGYVTPGTLKSAEALICYRGLLRLGVVSGNERYIRAAAAYWRSIRDYAIGPTGNGSVYEMWSQQAANPNELTNDHHPYENCVAVTWMQLSVELFAVTGDPNYMDEYERTLFNHLLGAQAIDGRDFSYYQGNFGTKMHMTNSGWYACCRYRGMTMLAHLPEHVVFERENALVVALYTASETEARVCDVNVRLRQRTDYPRDGRVELEIDPESPIEFAVQLRVPSGATLRAATITGEEAHVTELAGLASISRRWSPGDRLTLEFEFTLSQTYAVLDQRPAVLTTFGPLVLAVDSREGAPVETLALKPLESNGLGAAHPDDWSRIVRFHAEGATDGERGPITLVDYATAGSFAPDSDRFRVWVTARSDQPTDS